MTAAHASTFEIIPLACIQESPLNPRKHFDQAKLEELAQSIREHGILTPLLARPAADMMYELAAGHRRFRAAAIAGIATVPVMIREMSDQQFAEVLTIENLQREDIHPIEESDGYHSLIERYGYTPALLAERVGRSESYIAKRLALAKLVQEAKDEFLRGNIELGHAVLLCRLEEKDQKRALKAMFEDVTEWDGSKHQKIGTKCESVSGLKMWIEQEIFRDLSTVPWNKDDAGLLKKAGACTRCSKRTGSNLVLFDDTKRGDHCLDDTCWNQKLNTSIAATEKRFAADNRALLKASSNWTNEAGVLKSQEYKLIFDSKGKGKFCDHAEKALMVDGRQRGWVLDICRSGSCKTHFPGRGYSTRDVPRAQTFADIWSAKKTRLEDKIKLETNRELWRQIVHDVPEEFNRPEMTLVGQWLIDRCGHDGRRELCAALSIEGEKAKYGIDFVKPLEDYMERLVEKNVPGFLVGLALHGFGYRAEEMAHVAKLYGIDAAGIEKAIATPLRAEFEKKKARAVEADVKKKREAKRAAASAKKTPKKAATPKTTDRKCSASDEEDADE